MGYVLFAKIPPTLAAAIITTVGEKYHKSLGIMVSTKQEMNFYSDLGFNVIAVGTEMNLLTDKILNLIENKS